LLPFLIVFCLFTSCSRLKKELPKENEINSLIDTSFALKNLSVQNAKTILSLAKSNQEKAIAYLNLGETLYGEGDYYSAIDLAKRSDKFIVDSDSSEMRMRACNLLIMSYRRAGLIVESDQAWGKFQRIVAKVHPNLREVNLLYTQSKICDIDEDFCQSAELRKRYFEILENSIQNKERQIRHNFATLAQLAYVQYKCGKIEEAKSTMNKLETTLQKIEDKNYILLYDFYLMDKALMAVHDNQEKQAIQYFDQALKVSTDDNQKAIAKLVLKERLEANIDPVDQKLVFTNMMLKLVGMETSVTKDVSAKEAEDKIAHISLMDRYLITLLVALVFVLALLLVSYLAFRRRNRKIRLKYLQIKEDLNAKLNRDSKDSDLTDFSTPNTVLSENLKTEVIISTETEQDIVKQLVIFEKKKLFNKKGLSAVQMAVMLKTNAKYLSFILKKYRDSDFYNYISTCRIDFIVQELNEKPILLQYKISALSDMCGYNTHSQFGSAFKNIKGLSPSQYINLLRKDIESSALCS